MPRHTLLAATVLITASLLSGCTSAQRTLSAPPAQSVSAAPAAMVDTLGLGQPESADASKAKQKIAKTDSLRDKALRISSDATRQKVSSINRLYASATKHISAINMPASDSSRAFAEEDLEKAIDLISELIEKTELGEDSSFRTLAQNVIETYDTHIQKIDALDSDSPALAVRERLFGDASKIVVDENAFKGIAVPKTQIPLELNKQVEQYITYYSTRARGIFQRYLDRSEIYFPTLEKILAEEQMPPEMIYLCILESGVNPAARSRANALGMWQFMRATGRYYGLAGNQWFDERQDIFKATRSSMRHLKDLYKTYGDWYLVLAAYNSGGGRVNRAVRKSGTKDFWQMSKHFRRETNEYVPRYIAVAIIAMSPEKFGFAPLKMRQPITCAEVPMPASVSLPTIARYTGLNLDTLRFLNPELIKDMTPPAYRGYKLRVPTDKGEEVAARLDSIPLSERQHFLAHKVRKGDGLTSIAAKYRTSVPMIVAVNDLKARTAPVGRVLMIPTSPEQAAVATYTMRELSDENQEKRGRRSRRYRRSKRKSKHGKADKSKKVKLASAARPAASGTH
ncbi:MAG: transglycosylase SLT domain-containing protein [Rhizobacter sp.]|nr:transglycosylase SLT domain-containing protein [Chlorobiales bacterium]